MRIDSEQGKAILRGVWKVARAAFGFIMAAAQPMNGWQWLQFFGGLALALEPIVTPVLAPSKGITNMNTAKRIDAMIEAKAKTMAGKMEIPPPPEEGS